MLTQGFLKIEAEQPSARHVAIFVSPLVASFAALPLWIAAEQVMKILGNRWRLLVIPPLAATLALVAFLNYQFYFDDWNEYHRKLVPNHNEVAAAIHDFEKSDGSLDNAYIKTWPYWLDAGAMQVELGELDWPNFLDDIEGAAAHVNDAQAQLYLLNINDHESVARLQQLYPRGELVRVSSSIQPTFDFLVFQVPGS